ncbi:Cullin repeat-like-containing domain protein [Protomyces lactucae-debilis]|uniref:Exocyst complex component EXO84 n=1 Tax=Protomyces lactucae-debilis TaxID=2754530 RepID=A0A1Y2FNV4_PROLT|nr:Cullin repeat-like-containing domain protein [Protomyces lactucae-debilis]ORY85609.1 Cullin repeat-like-containing domain protein [Protomyces lactucae-debilis]
MSSNGLPSLRKKKSSKDAPRRKSLFDGGPPEVGSKEKNRVQDRIKRRLSTKISHPINLMPSQPLPSNAMQNITNHRTPIIPQEARQQHQQRQQEKLEARAAGQSRSRPAFDPKVFRDPNFNADAYVKQMLASASPEELDGFYRNLRDNGEAVNDEMQKNVFNNYKDFIIISKEIGTIQADMASLRDLLGELQTVTTTLTEDAEAAITSADQQQGPSNGASPAVQGTSRRGQRNSIVDFHQLNKYHLQALWQQIEGSQKFLPADEGRRVVRESGAWAELNAATWRPKGKVHLVLLNDHLLVAAKRPKPSGSGHRLIAEQCFPLQEIRLSGFDEEGMEDAISVRMSGSREKFAFRANTVEEKAVMLKAAKHELGELQASMRERGEQMAQQGDAQAIDVTRATQIKRLSRRLSKQGLGVDSPQVDAEVDLEVVRERIDELDQCIAHRQFKQAVRSIGRGRQLVQESGPQDLAAQLTALQLDERAERLSRLLAAELAAEAHKPHSVVRLARFLVAMGASSTARKAYLDARAATIRQRSRQVSFDADLPIYLSDVATVTFHLIKQSAYAYLHAFTSIVLPTGQNSSMGLLGTNKDLFNSIESASATSAFVAWSANQVELFAKLFNAQTWGLEPDSETYRACLEAVSRQMAVLRDVGMDLHCAAQRSLGMSTA